MNVRRVVLGGLVAGVLTVGGAASASANIAWCLSDPPAQVQTASGATLSVNTSVSVARSEVRFLKAVHNDATTSPDGAGGTLVTVHVYLPTGITSARIVSSVNRYAVSATAIGHGGTVVTLYLDVPTS
jgi:hypothetical protein